MIKKSLIALLQLPRNQRNKIKNLAGHLAEK
jgi:hypothetical protein